jgi:hypothetical protein
VNERSLETRLGDARAFMQLQPTRDLRAGVRTALELDRTTHAPGRSGRLGRGLLLGIAAVLVIGGTVAAAIGVRHLFVTFVPGPGVPIDTGVPVGSGWDFGQEVTLGDARSAAGSGSWIVAPPSLGQPNQVFMRSIDQVLLVSLVYDGRPGLPAADQGGPGAMLVEIGGLFGEMTLHKSVPRDGTVEEVELGQSVTGHWITGTQHDLTIDTDGPLLLYHVAAETLVWEYRGATYRLETRAGKDATAAIASEVIRTLRGTP